ncbi:TPA: restriction endonuclease subunit S, partial [Klebsiella pneumoniae]|nr:restriction endonuclease subunit S [Klebsiella pneumoniae]
MSGDKKLSLVPRLRFPEFQEKNGWEKHPLSEMLEEVLRPVVMKDDEDYSLVTVKRRYGGIVLRDVLKGRDILVKSQFRIKKNDFLISKRQIVHCACGVVPEEHDDAIVSNEYTILRAKGNCDICFFNYFVQQYIVGRSFLECSVGIVIEKMLFKQEQWLKKKFFFPTLPEQQKIADCLSSLDELLTAEVQKLDALKKYKKSMLQQLFPRQGEKVPRLRFPEFEKSEAWVEKELHQLGELISGLTYSPNDVGENGLLVLRSSNIQNGRIVLDDNVYVREDINGANLSLENDILICVRNGSKKLIGKNALIPKGMPLCTHGAFMTVFRSDFAKFVIQLFQTDVYEKQVAAD